MRARTKAARWVAVAALAIAFAFATVTGASAAPTDQTLGLTALQAKLDAAPGGVVTGYLKTVTKGSTIETIPVDVLSITSDSNAAYNSTRALIMFEAKGPKIDQYGAIVAGMSGSPIYIEDGGVDKVIGALSYGDWFTRGGLGLATPIEAMVDVQTKYGALGIQSLSTPVATDESVLTQVVVTTDANVAKAADKSGTFVAKPLSMISVGGLPPASRAYKTLAANLADKGVSLMPNAAPFGSEISGFETPLVPGSSIAAGISRGDFWVAGIGTTSYVDSDTVIAFGHPLMWDGSTQYYMANAWIDGIWASDDTPYKIGRMGKVRGAITQDRGAAILGKSSLMPLEASISARVLDTTTGQETTGTTYMPRKLLNGNMWGGLPSAAVYDTALRACDDWMYNGSAVTTTTITVSDGTDTYTITRRNMWDDSWDVAYWMTQDVDALVYSFESYNMDGTGHADILSVDFEAALTDQRATTAKVVDVAVPGGLGIGDNRVVVSYLLGNSTATQTLDATLTVPKGTSLSGELSVYGAGFSFDDEYMYGGDGFSNKATMNTTMPAPGSVAELVGDIRDEPTNLDFAIEFSSMGDEELDIPLLSSNDEPIRTIVHTDWMATGYVSKPTSDIYVEWESLQLPYNGYSFVYGELTGFVSPARISIYTRGVDATSWTTAPSVRVYDDSEFPGEGYFFARVGPLTRNTYVKFVYPGDAEYIGVRTQLLYKVKAYVSVASSANSIAYGRSVTLSTTVKQANAGATVVFQTMRGGVWTTIATRTLSDTGRASCTWTPRSRGSNTYRVWFKGGSQNLASSSAQKTVYVY